MSTGLTCLILTSFLKNAGEKIYRYLEGMTWEDIGELFHANKSTIKRWHRKAIEEIVLPEEQITKKLDVYER